MSHLDNLILQADKYYGAGDVSEVLNAQGQEVNTKGEVIDFDDEVSTEESGFCKYNPDINKHAKSSPEGLAEILIFVITSQKVAWDRLMIGYPKLLRFLYDGGKLAKYNQDAQMGSQYKGSDFDKNFAYGDEVDFSYIIMGWKTKAVQHIWENRAAIYSEVIKILNGKEGGEVGYELFKFLLTKLSGFELAKAGFAIQLILGRSGCIDSVNQKIYTNFPKELINPKTGRLERANVKKYMEQRYQLYNQYIESLSDNGSRFLWDKWTDVISAKLKYAGKPRDSYDIFGKKDNQVSPIVPDTSKYGKTTPEYQSSKFSDRNSPQQISQDHNPENIKNLSGLFEANRMNMKKNTKLNQGLMGLMNSVKRKTSKNVLFERMERIGGMKLDENSELYHDTQSSAVEAAVNDARQKGYEINDEDVASSQFTQGWVGYENDRSDSIPLYKDGMEQGERLQITIYRMPSGKYELTHYIN